MIAPQILHREEWEPELIKRGCRRIPPGGLFPRLSTAEFWATADNRVFTVPVDNNEGRLRADDLHRVLIEIERLKPIGDM